MSEIKKPRLSCRNWNIKQVRLREIQIKPKEYKKVIVEIADILYHYICQLEKDQLGLTLSYVPSPNKEGIR